MISPSVSLYHTSTMFRLRQSIGFWSFWTLMLRFVLQLQPLNSSEENHMRRRMYAEVRQGHTRLALVRDLAYGWPSAGIHVNGTGEALVKNWRRHRRYRRFWRPRSGRAGWFFQSNWLDSRHLFREMVRNVWRTGRKTKHRRQPQQLLNEIVAGDLQLEPGMWKQCPPHAVWSDLHKGSAAATVKRMKKRYRLLRILGLQSSINEVALIQESSLQ